MAEAEYVETGRPGALDGAVAAWQFVLANPTVTVEKAEIRLAVVESLAISYMHRHWARGEPLDLDTAIAYFFEILDSGPLGLDQRTRVRGELGLALRQRHLNTGRVGDLDSAIQIYRERMELSPSEGSDYVKSLDDLGNALLERYVVRKDLRHLQDAVSQFDAALNTSPRDLQRADVLNDIAIALDYRYTVKGEFSDSKRAVSLLHEGVDIVEEVGKSPHLNVIEKGRIAAKLARMLRNLYSYTDDIEYLKQSINAYETSVEYAPPLSPDWSRRLGKLGDVLADGYARTGEISYLEQAVEGYRRSFSSRRDTPQFMDRLEEQAIHLVEDRSVEESARLWRYRQRRSRLLCEALKLDWTQGVVLVVPSIPSPDHEHFRVIASEDMLASASMEEALITAGCPPEHIDTEIAEEVGPKDTRNLILICSPKRNPVTKAVLTDPIVSAMTNVEVFCTDRIPESAKSSKTPQPPEERWAFRIGERVMESPSYDQKKALEAQGKNPMKGPLEDYALLARLPNPWNLSASVILVAGLRAFGTWGAARFVREHGADLLQQTEGRDFVMILSVRTESFRVEADPSPAFIRLLDGPPAPKSAF